MALCQVASLLRRVSRVRSVLIREPAQPIGSPPYHVRGTRRGRPRVLHTKHRGEGTLVFCIRNPLKYPPSMCEVYKCRHE